MKNRADRSLWKFSLGLLVGVLVAFWHPCESFARSGQTLLAQQPVQSLVLPVLQSFHDNPLQRADTASPRDTLHSFLSLTNELKDIIRQGGFLDHGSPAHRPLVRAIFDCLDTSEIPEFAHQERAGEVAVCLKEILDRVTIPDWADIPGKEEIAAAEHPADFDRWQIPGTRITIVKIESGPRRHEYLFSIGTVTRAVQYYEDVAGLPYRLSGPPRSPGLYRWFYSAPGKPYIGRIANLLPDWARQRQYLSVTLWKWAGILIALIVAILAMYLVIRVQRLFRRLIRRDSRAHFVPGFVLPLAIILIPLIFKDFLGSSLIIRGNVFYFISFCANLVAILGAIIGSFFVANWIAELIILSPRIRPEGLDAQLIRIVCKIAGLVVAVIIFLVGGQYLGVRLGTLLASAGVGGFAVALAAQDTLKTLFGTLVLMADKPFRSGDRIITGKYDGFIEEVGLRSTKLRLLTGNQAVIPNDELARNDIENVGRRPHIRRSSVIRLPLETPRKKVIQAVEIIRSILDQREGLDPDRPSRVFFSEIQDDCFGIRMMYWFAPPDYWRFLEFSECVNLEMFEAFEKAGIQFAVPLRIREIGKDKGDASINISD